MDQANERSAIRLTVTGLVQGIGYRPFVRREAKKRSICGFVQNSGGGVCIYACGHREALNNFVRCLRTSPPKGTIYLTFEASEAEEQSHGEFSIIESDDRPLMPMVSPDLAPCADCEKVLSSAEDRRYRYPFLSCAACGPRFSLQTALPYDRSRTSMTAFEMCECCTEEYQAIDGRYSYAQTLSCPDCGPKLTYHAASGQKYTKDKALDACCQHLRQGGIDAIKNVGGFHLACRADDEEAVQSIRTLKGREAKPFAILFADLSAVRAVAEVSEAEEAMLTSPARPIVLLRKKADGSQRIAPSVCSDSLYIGAMLPSSPLQHLLASEVGCLVMTSANRSGEPLAAERSELLGWLPPTVGLLDNDRPIVAVQDDSLCFAAECNGSVKPLFLRRARGYAPLPIELDRALDPPILAAGGDLKAVFALATGTFAYPSPYIGDLEDLATAERYSGMLDHMSRLLGIAPTRLACDLHPSYYSGKLAQKWMNSVNNNGESPHSIIKVQHHHAHIASVMAEHRLDRVLGFAFDGTGYGIDGTVWGGELLYCDGADFKRLMHLKALPMLGGDSGATDCRRTAATFLLSAGVEAWDADSVLWKNALSMGVGSVLTSSMGRLFDAVASILDVCHRNAYEGQAATMLESVAVLWREQGGESAELTLAAEGDVWRSDRLIADIDEQKRSGVPIGALALGFHRAIASAVAEAAELYSRAYDCARIALSGGVFANRLLLADCTRAITERGLSVYLNEQLPAGDGNIAIGQVYIAAQTIE